jgi:hypothetical protein
MLRSPPLRNRARRNRKGRHPLSMEPLESRCLLVVVSVNPAFNVTDDFSGVANLVDLARPIGFQTLCTGTLLSTGSDVLTAAHCFETATAAVWEVRFEKPVVGQPPMQVAIPFHNIDDVNVHPR